MHICSYVGKHVCTLYVCMYACSNLHMIARICSPKCLDGRHQPINSQTLATLLSNLYMYVLPVAAFYHLYNNYHSCIHGCVYGVSIYIATYHVLPFSELTSMMQ